MIIDRLLGLTEGVPYINNVYVQSLLILIIMGFLGAITLWIFGKYLQKWAEKTKTKVDDLIFENIKNPLFYFILALGLKLAILNLGINGIVNKLVNSLMAIVFVLIISKTADVIIDVWGETIAKKTKSNLDDVLLPLFHKIVKVVFIIIGILWILRIWEINITPYLAGAGILGIVLGFSLQDSLKNVFGGISILVDKNFKVGDPIRLESGDLGVVQDIGLRSTKIKTYNAEILFVPNGQLANMKIRNYVEPNTRVRKIVEFGVIYGADIGRVKTVVLAALKKIQDIYDDPYMDVIFVKMGDSSLEFQARFWVDWDDAYSKWLEATEKIYQTLVKEGIEIAFPTRTIHLKKD